MARGFDEGMLNEIQQFIEQYQTRYKKAPSIREIGKEFQSFFKNSYSKVNRYVHELEELDRLSFTRNKGINVKPVLISGKLNTISEVGRCPCGTPFFAVENVEATYDFPSELVGNEPHFILTAVGHSMVDAGIFDGDKMFVKKQNYANSGEIVIALIGDEATAKIYLPQKQYAILRAANSSVNEDGTKRYPDIKTKELQILGVVDNVLHRPKAKR
ncbi:MAG: hypothetical protein IJW43_06610 [Clostridia bacterium]|nr:hypothetical protein [Clostridia bacterium]